jgi:hypothetical protein
MYKGGADIMKKITLIFSLIIGTAAFSGLLSAENPEDSENNLFAIELIKPIERGKTKTAEAKLSNLTDEAVKLGFDKYCLSGDIQYETLPDGLKATISWQSVFIAETADLKEPLNTAFETRFLFDPGEEIVKVGQILNVAGEINELSAVVYALKERTGSADALYAEKTPEGLNKFEEETEEETGGSPNYFSGGSPDLSAPEDSNTETGGLDNLNAAGPENERITREKCSPRIDYTQETAYLQTKKVVTDLLTGDVSEEPCRDTGQTIPFIKEPSRECGLNFDHIARAAYKQYKTYISYEGQKTEIIGCAPDKTASIPYTKGYEEIDCPVVIDFGAKKAYIQHKDYIFDDFTEDKTKQIEITPCTNDFEKFYDLYPETETCGLRHDFVDRRTYVQEKFQYTNSNGEKTDAVECRDSEKFFPHFLTDRTCIPEKIFDNVIIYKRWAFTDDGGIINYVSECKPFDAGEVSVQTEYCDPKYYHDLKLNQSFYMTRLTYTDSQRIKHYLTECKRDTDKKVFPHRLAEPGCPGIKIKHMNLEHYSVVPYRTIIETDEDGIIEAAACGISKENIPYTPIFERGTETQAVAGTYTFTVPPEVTTVSVTLVGGGGGMQYEERCPGTTHGCGWAPVGPGRGGEVEKFSHMAEPGTEIKYTVGSNGKASAFGHMIASGQAGTGYNGYGLGNREKGSPGYIEISYNARKYRRFGGTIWDPKEDSASSE